MGKRLAFPSTLVLLHLTVVTVSAQARIEALIPEDAPIRAYRLGADQAVAAAVGMELQPGDSLVALEEDRFLELSCLMGEARTTYQLSTPFRVLIDVPTEAACHIGLEEGDANVLAEDTRTETTAGDVPLSSAGTQYAIEVRRTRDGTEHKVTVFDGLLRSRSPAGRGIEVTAGRTAVRRAGSTEWSNRANTAAETDRAATVYARFDLEAARRSGAAIQDSNDAVRELKTLHYEVLSNPSDTAKRVALAKRQIEYRISDKAFYNLERVDVTSDTKLQRYQIDAAVLRSNLGSMNRARFDAAISRDTAASSAAVRRQRVSERAARDAVGSYVRVPQARARAAVDSLQRTIRGGRATSREYFELAKSYLTLRDSVNARSAGTRAFNLVAQDRRLTDAEIAELRVLLARRR